MKSNKIGLIVLFILGLIPTLIYAQPIVQVNKLENKVLNRLEELQVNLCFEMNDYLVVSPKDTSLLDKANIKYRVLTSDNELNPLYLISAKPGIELKEQAYLDEILINDVVRLEKANTNKQAYLPQHGIKFVPVKISSKQYQNKATKYNKLSHSNQEMNRDLDQVLDSVEADSVAWFIQKLENFQTRYALVHNRREISEWIASQFTRFGYSNVAIDSFYVANYGTWQYNVVCIDEGSVNPDKYVVVGGHHDSIITPNVSDAMHFAPGADDNASGVAAVLEIARIFKLNNVQPRNSIRFTTFAMEEFGLYGGYHDAEYLAENDIDVIAMLNSDMISNHTAEDYTFTVRGYPGAEYLTNLALSNSSDLEMNTITLDTSLSGSDSWAYHVNGMPAIFFSEYEFSPYYHSYQDMSQYTNPDYAAEFIKLVASVTMSVSNLPASADNFMVEDVGDGSSIIATWDEVEEAGVSYVLEVKNMDSSEVESFSVESNIYTITDLTDNTPYEITLFSDLDNILSFGQTRFITPQSQPRLVEGFEHESLNQQIRFSWDANQELDIAGYKLYRKNTNDSEFSELVSLNSDVYSYLDSTTEDNVWYDYTITAFDNDNNESEASEIITARHLSFNNGIGIFDFTFFSENNLLYPAQQSVQNFYADVFGNYDYNLILNNAQAELGIDDFGIYSTVVIIKSSFTTNAYHELNETLQQYSNLGGNILVSAADPIRLLGLNNETYPATFSEGDLANNLFGINATDNNSTARFARAQDLSWNIPDLEIEPSKIPTGLNHRLFSLEAFSTSDDDSVQDIMSYQSDLDTSPQNDFDDYIVAVSKVHANSKAIITSIPLYFIKTQQAKQFIETAMEFFDETVAIENNEITPPAVNLQLTNYPNPFNPSTTIRFNLPNKSIASLKIYNLKGQLVRNLFKGSLKSGNHNLAWNGDDNKGKKVSSGIYLYKLTTDDGLAQTNRMVLLK